MSVFQYQALTNQGKWQRGQLTAADQRAAAAQLGLAGLHPTTLAEKKPSLWRQPLELPTTRVKARDFVIFCRQLAVMLRAGLSLAVALSSLAEQASGGALKKILTDIVHDVREGVSFSQAARKKPRLFSPLFLGMVEVGESTGNLDDVMDKLAAHYERADGIRGKIATALTYPVFIGIMACGVVVYLVTFMVPTLLASYNLPASQLPAITKVVLAISDLIRHRWYLAPVLLGALFLFRLVAKKQEVIRYRLDSLKLRLPILGPYLGRSQLALFCRTFASLYTASVPLLTSLSICEGALSNEVYRRIVHSVRTTVRDGGRLSQGLARRREIPPMMVNMLEVGEQSGNMEQVLDKVAFFYETDVAAMTDRLQALLEPVLILLVAGIVGTVVMAAMLPIFTMYQHYANMGH